MSTNSQLLPRRNETEDDVELSANSGKRRGGCGAKFLVAIIVTSMTLLSLSIVLQLLSFTPVSSSQHTTPHGDHDHHNGSDLHMSSSIYHSCGETPETALARNCTFDLLSFSWLPWECYDSTLTSEFLKYDWTWYHLAASAHGTISPDKLTPVSQKVASLGNETQLYVSVEYHVVHCIYMWRKLHRGLEMNRLHLNPGSASGAWLDSYTSEFNHTNHCSMFLLDFVDSVSPSRKLLSASEKHPAPNSKAMNEISVTIFTKYPTCYPVPSKEREIELE